mgnify:CR=1 FL=1
MTEIERLEKEIELLKLDLRQARLETEHLRHDLQKSLGYDINIYKTEYINCRFFLHNSNTMCCSISSMFVSIISQSVFTTIAQSG